MAKDKKVLFSRELTVGEIIASYFMRHRDCRKSFNVQYVDYMVVDPRPGGGSWRTIVVLSSPQEAKEAAEVLAENLRNPPIIVYRNKVIIKKYVTEWKIMRILGVE